METTGKNHAIENAKAHLESIRAWARDSELAERDDLDDATLNRIIEEHGFIGVRFNASELQEFLSEEADEMPLSVMVRDPWRVPGADPRGITAEEFEILLTTGGPALRIIGELTEYGEPLRARMQWQDWGTPWTDLHGSDLPEGMEPQECDELLAIFAHHFYFGEG